MRNKRIKILTVAGLIAMIALQSIWLYNAYMQFSKSIYKDSNEILRKSLNIETSIRFERSPKGTTVRSAPIKETAEIIPEVAYMNEALQKIGLEFSLADVDSLATNFLKKDDINSKIVICLVNPKTEEILEKSRNDWNIHSLGILKTKVIPIKTDLSQGVQMILLNPYYTIMKRLGLLLISTVILMIFVAACIIYQIKIIAKQRKIAQIRQDFSYAMIHDMKTPLNSIIAANSLLHSGRIEDKAEMKENLFTAIDKQSNQLLALTNKVLTLSKLESQTLKMNKSTVSLGPMIEDLIDRFTINATKPIHFELKLEAKEIWADNDFMKEVISNLIDNAIKYSKEIINIQISSFCSEKDTIIKVRDNGIGISEKDQKIIFNKFERASAVKRTRKGGATGFGLGLNYVYQVIEAHEGKIYVNSIKGDFTEFTLFIPKIVEEL